MALFSSPFTIVGHSKTKTKTKKKNQKEKEKKKVYLDALAILLRVAGIHFVIPLRLLAVLLR